VTDGGTAGGRAVDGGAVDGGVVASDSAAAAATAAAMATGIEIATATASNAGTGQPDRVSKRAVRVRCERCGPRVAAVSSVRLLGKSGGWEYLFTCPGCGARVRRRADAALRAALRGAGAAELTVHGPQDGPVAPAEPQ
jgi:hypothetical protein